MKLSLSNEKETLFIDVGSLFIEVVAHYTNIISKTYILSRDSLLNNFVGFEISRRTNRLTTVTELIDLRGYT